MDSTNVTEVNEKPRLTDAQVEEAVNEIVAAVAHSELSEEDGEEDDDESVCSDTSTESEYPTISDDGFVDSEEETDEKKHHDEAELVDIMKKLEALLTKLESGEHKITDEQLKELIVALGKLEIKQLKRWWVTYDSGPTIERDDMKKRVMGLAAGEPNTIPYRSSTHYNPRHYDKPIILGQALEYADDMVAMNRRRGHKWTKRGTKHTVTEYTPEGAKCERVHVKLYLEKPGMTAEFDHMPEHLHHVWVHGAQSSLKDPERLELIELVSMSCEAKNCCLVYDMVLWVSEENLDKVRSSVSKKLKMTGDKLAVAAYNKLFGGYDITHTKELPTHDLTPSEGKPFSITVYGSVALEYCEIRAGLWDCRMRAHKLLCGEGCICTGWSRWIDLRKPCHVPVGDEKYAEVLHHSRHDESIIDFVGSTIEEWLRYTVEIGKLEIAKVDLLEITGAACCFGYGTRDSFPYLHSAEVKNIWESCTSDLTEHSRKMIQRKAWARLTAELERIPFADDFKTDIKVKAACGPTVMCSVNMAKFVEDDDKKFIVSDEDGDTTSIKYSEVPKNFVDMVWDCIHAQAEVDVADDEEECDHDGTLYKGRVEFVKKLLTEAGL
ncbi:protein ORF137 [Cyprinid herpesvirus 3]|uniref:Uncharacterized protein n=1 Tax=Cyprinid herpesvirus 3 TaxID=180230 RepID=A4FTN1_CYHV3|nr:protein ORF137 [Cyprinid herpesvirus 3]AOO32854.1 protein ORF137 [Cyprinid herpesvirus 3]AOO33324.1 protein ORF137 [Cyprinid herpesvirus 3]AOO33480.1 protein ORF137 [Cyprinid herpesvirus 3]AVL28388.1 protein ORF137 [Cyprinid herpesvirus 3]